MDQPFLIVAAGLAVAFAAAWRSHRVLPDVDPQPIPVPTTGRAAVLAGSCSASTRGQVGSRRRLAADLVLDPLALARDERGSEDAVLDWADSLPKIDAAAHCVKCRPGPGRCCPGRARPRAAGALVERAFGNLARALVARGVERLVVAGGKPPAVCSPRLGCAVSGSAGESNPGCHGPRPSTNHAWRSPSSRATSAVPTSSVTRSARHDRSGHRERMGGRRRGRCEAGCAWPGTGSLRKPQRPSGR